MFWFNCMYLELVHQGFAYIHWVVFVLDVGNFDRYISNYRMGVPAQRNHYSALN